MKCHRCLTKVFKQTMLTHEHFKHECHILLLKQDQSVVQSLVACYFLLAFESQSVNQKSARYQIMKHCNTYIDKWKIQRHLREK